MSSLPPKQDEAGWPPRSAPEIAFSSAEARGLLPTRRARARVAAVGADLERAAPMSDNEIAQQNLKMLNRVLVLALIVAGVSITLSIVSSVVVWGAVARASEVASVVGDRLSVSQVDATIGNMINSVADVKSTTGSASNLALEVEQAGDRVVAAVNASAIVLERLSRIAGDLVAHPSVQLSLGGAGAGMGGR